MQVCESAYVRVYMYVYMCAYTNIGAYPQRPNSVLYVCVYVRVRVSVYACMCVCVYVCVCVCV